MAKGFFKGVLWGAGASLSSLALISVLAPDPGSKTSVAASGGQTVTDGTPVAPGARSGDAGPSAVGVAAQEVDAPEPDTLAGLLEDTLAPAAVPLTGGAASNLGGAQEPQSDALSGISAPQTNAPQVSFAESGGLQTPTTDQELSISTDPAQPVAPSAEQQEAAFAPAPEPAEAAPVAQNDDAVVSGAEAPDAAVALDPAQPSAPEAGESTSGMGETPAAEPRSAALQPSVETDAPRQSDAPADTADAAPEAPAPRVETDAPAQPARQIALADAPEPLAPEASAPEASDAAALPAPQKVTNSTEEGESASARVTAELDVETPQGASTPATTTGVVEQQIAPSPGTQSAQPLPGPSANETQVAAVVTQPAAPPAPPVADAGTVNVRVNRLPTLGAGDEEVAEEAVPEVVEAAVEDDASEAPEDVRPFDRFAAPFETAEEKPLMSIVLVDDGVDLDSSTAGLAALMQLPYPVSFAVDALLPDAATRMSAYRAAGFEVLAAVDLPAGARAEDAEVNLSVALDALPEVVGVMDGVGTGVQTTPDAGRQVAQILAQTGHGFVTQNRGLNTVQKQASRIGVPSAVVFRDFDAKGQSSAVIRRFLDQAAFRAGQEGSVIVLGRLREETLGALVLWALQDRAATVAMAPVSAVLRVQ